MTIAENEPTTLYLVKQLELAIRSRMDSVLRPVGLTVSQYTALSILERRADLTSAELARNSFVSAQAMVGMIIELEQRGLISRERDPENGRRLVISLSALGRAALDEARAGIEQIEAVAFASLTSHQRAELRDTLGRSRTALSDRSADQL